MGRHKNIICARCGVELTDTNRHAYAGMCVDCGKAYYKERKRAQRGGHNQPRERDLENCQDCGVKLGIRNYHPQYKNKCVPCGNAYRSETTIRYKLKNVRTPFLMKSLFLAKRRVTVLLDELSTREDYTP